MAPWWKPTADTMYLLIDKPINVNSLDKALPKKSLWKKMVPSNKLKEHPKAYMANHYQAKVNISHPSAVA